MLMLPILICGAIAAGSAPASCDKAHERLILEPSGVASLQRAQYQQFQQPYQQFSPNGRYQQYSGSQQTRQQGALIQQAQSNLSQQQQLLQQLQQNMGVGNGAGGANSQPQPQQGGRQNFGQGQGQGQAPSDAEMRMRMMLMQRSMGFGGIFGGPNGIISGFMKGNGSSNSSCSGYNEYAARRACENGDSWAAQRIEGHESSGSEYDWYNR